MIGEVPVLFIMKKPIVVSGEVSVYDVAKLMLEYDLPCVLVVCKKSNQESVEVATEKDILKKVLIKKLPPDKVKVEDVSSSRLITVPPNITIDEALKLMSKYKTRELFIVDGGKIVGVITEEDLIKVTPDIISTLKELVDYLIQIIDEVTNETDSNKGEGDDRFKKVSEVKNRKNKRK